MSSSRRGVSAFERIEALLANREIYELGELIPRPERHHGGRERTYPDFMLLVYEALISVYTSARQVEAELAHPHVWRFIRRQVRRHRPGVRLPAEPMRRHHYLYGRNRYLQRPDILDALTELHRKFSARQAREIGLLDPDGPGSFTHPDSRRLIHGDGKVITPLFRARPGDTTVDRHTCEIRELRHEPDAALHWEGTGEAAWGTKFVIVAAHGEAVHSRMLLDFEVVPDPGAEARLALDCISRLAPAIPGAQGVVYDTALRGVHHQHLIRDLGMLSINRVAAKQAGSNEPRRSADQQRVEKTVHVEDKTITLPNGSEHTIQLFAHAGAIGIGQPTDTGDLEFVELRRVRTSRTQDKTGRYRWYNHYQLPDHIGGGTITVRLHQTDEDTARKLNRTENVRPIPPSDPDFAGLFRQRNDAESINRALEDTMFLRRAHSIGHQRQLVNLLGYALTVNSLALHRHRRRLASDVPVAA